MLSNNCHSRPTCMYLADPDEPPRKQCKTDTEKVDGKPAASTAAASSSDEIEETLLCSICQELLHDCVR